MTRRDFLRLRPGQTCAAAERADKGDMEQAADVLRHAFMRAMSAGVDPATLAPEELVRRFSSEATSNDTANG